MAFGVRILPETLRSLPAASVVGGYTAIGTGFANPIRIFTIVNTMDQGVIISFDNTGDHLAVPANAGLTYDVSANREGHINDSSFFAKGTVIYAKRMGAAPMVGNVYLSVFYGLGD